MVALESTVQHLRLETTVRPRTRGWRVEEVTFDRLDPAHIVTSALPRAADVISMNSADSCSSRMVCAPP